MGISREHALSLGGVLAEAVRKIEEEDRARSSLIPGCHRLYIEGWHPARLNQLLGHHMVAHRIKAADRRRIADEVSYQGCARATGKRRVHLTIHLGKGQRAADPDAYWKSLLDALSHAGLLVDDRRECVTLDPVEYARGEKATTIELYDL